MKKLLKLVFSYLSILFVSVSCDIITEDEVNEIVPFSADEVKKNQRKAYVEYFTGHLCGNCPSKGADQIKQIVDVFGEDKVVFLSVHTGFFARSNASGTKYFNDYTSVVGDDLESTYQIAQQGTPNGMINRLENTNNRAYSPTDWAQKVQEILKDSVNFELIWLDAQLNTSSISIRYRVKASSNLENYETFAYLVEDSIVSWQKDYELDNPDVESYPHRYVLRDNFKTPQIFSISTNDSLNVNVSVENKQIYQTKNLYAFIYVMKNEEIIQVEKFKLE